LEARVQPRKAARLDIRIGVLASAVAMCGLGMSILTGNEDAAWFGRIETKDQVGLLIAALMVFALATVKLRRYRRTTRR
jgi:hypothetical protein